jgi:hypothetical protein
VCEVGDDLENLAHQLGVERAGRFVEQQHARAHRQCPGNRDTLLLAARKLLRIGIHLVGEADAAEQMVRTLACVLRLVAQHLNGAFHHVLGHREMREQHELLEHHAELPALARDGGAAQDTQVVAHALVAEQFAVEIDGAAVDRLELMHAAHQGRLAGTRRADDGDDLAFLHLERHAAQGLETAVALDDVVQADDRLRGDGCLRLHGSVSCRMRGHHAATPDGVSAAGRRCPRE